MFESLSEKLGGALRRLSGRGKITEENVREAMADVRTALLEADVHVEVVRDFSATPLCKRRLAATSPKVSTPRRKLLAWCTRNL